MAVNLLHKLPLTYSENGIQYYTRNNEQVNSAKNLTKLYNSMTDKYNRTWVKINGTYILIKK